MLCHLYATIISLVLFKSSAILLTLYVCVDKVAVCYNSDTNLKHGGNKHQCLFRSPRNCPSATGELYEWGVVCNQGNSHQVMRDVWCMCFISTYFITMPHSGCGITVMVTSVAHVKLSARCCHIIVLHFIFQSDSYHMEFYTHDIMSRFLIKTIRNSYR